MSYLQSIEDAAGNVRAFVSVTQVAYCIDATPGARCVTNDVGQDWTDARSFGAFVLELEAHDGTSSEAQFSVTDSLGRAVDIVQGAITSLSPYAGRVGGIATTLTRVQTSARDTSIDTTIAWGANGAAALAHFDPPAP